MWSNRKFPGYSKKSCWDVFVTVLKWSNAGVNQSGFVKQAFLSRYKLTRAFRQIVILQTQDLSKYSRFGSFKMAHVSQKAVGFTKISNNQQNILKKSSSSTLHCSSVQIYIIFLRHRCQIQQIMAGNGIVLTHCSKLLQP